MTTDYSPETGSPAKLEGALNAVAASLCHKFNNYAAHRNEKEDEWLRAIEQYNGCWDADDKTKIEKILGEGSSVSAPNINITRPKTDTAIAKLEDIQFPTGGDFNFYLRPSPVQEGIREALKQAEPTLEMQAEFAAAGGSPEETPSPQQLAQEQLRDYIDSARNMERQIRDDLNNANYGNKARLALFDKCVYGTAIIKGPYVAYKERTRYTDDYFPYVEQELVPTVSRVDPRHFYPCPSARLPEEVSDSFEVHFMDTEEVIELGNSPAFIREQVVQALEMQGNEHDLPSIIKTTSFQKSGMDFKNKFVVHEYHGVLDKQLLHELGEITEEQRDDPMQEFRGEAWFIDRILIRLSLDVLEQVKTSIYKVSVYKRDPNSLFGHGVPYLIRHVQRILNNAYLMLMDNAGLTSMPQIVINEEMIRPAQAGDDYTVRPGKVWHMTEYGVDVRQAIQFVNVPAQSEGLSQIIDMCLMFADMESMIPNHQQGEPVKANNMAGIAQVLSAMSVIQKSASLSWDDNITEPLIRDFYHYNMQHSDDDSIKGDMEVLIGGATSRIDAQMRGQDIERILGLSQMSEEFAMQIDPVKAFRELVANSRAGDVLRTKKEVEQKVAEMRQRQAQEQQQPDPQTLKAQAEIMKAQNAQQELELMAAKMQRDAEMDAQKLAAESEWRMHEVEARNRASLINLQEMQNNRELTLLEMANAKETTIAKLASEQDIEARRFAAAQAKIEADVLKQQEEINLKREMGEGI